MYLIGIDENESVFVAPKIWKVSENEVFWPPKTCKHITKLIKKQTKPNVDWVKYECRWLDLNAGKIIYYLS